MHADDLQLSRDWESLSGKHLLHVSAGRWGSTGSQHNCKITNRTSKGSQARLRLRLNGCYSVWPTICSSCTIKRKSSAWEQVLWFQWVSRQVYSRFELNMRKQQGAPINHFGTSGVVLHRFPGISQVLNNTCQKRRRYLNSAHFAVLRQRLLIPL